MKQLGHSVSGNKTFDSFVVKGNFAQEWKSLKIYYDGCLENALLLHISLKMHENSKNYYIFERKGKSFHNYCAAVICAAASTNFLLESEVRASTFRKMSNLNVF